MLIKKAVKLDKGSAQPLKAKVGKITREQLEEIAKTKHEDMTAADVDAAVRTFAWFCPLDGRDCGGRVIWPN